MEGFQDHQLPLTITFTDFKKAFDSIDRKVIMVMFAFLRHYGACGGGQRHQCIVYQLKKCSIGRQEYFRSLWDFYRSPAGWWFSFIPLHYSRWLPYEEGHIRSWLLSWNIPSTLKTISSQGIEWPGLRWRHCSVGIHNGSGTAQLTSTALAAKDLGLMISVFKTEYMTANCNPRPSLQVYSDHINQVTDFKYLGSKMASATNDLKRRKGLAVLFWKLERLWKASQLSHLCESEVILHHLCVNFSLCLWILGLTSRHGKQNQCFCHLLLQDHAWDKTTRLHIQHCYLFHDQHWASCVLCKKAPARFPWTLPSSSREEPAIRYAGKSKLQVPDTGTRVLDNTEPFWCSSIVCFWMLPARSKERKYCIFGQYWYTRNVPVFTNTGTFQYLGPEVYFFRYAFYVPPHGKRKPGRQRTSYITRTSNGC